MNVKPALGLIQPPAHWEPNAPSRGDEAAEALCDHSISLRVDFIN